MLTIDDMLGIIGRIDDDAALLGKLDTFSRQYRRGQITRQEWATLSTAIARRWRTLGFPLSGLVVGP